MAILLSFLGLYNTTIISYKFGMNKNLGEKMTKQWDKETISKARDITKKHCVNSDPKIFTDKLMNDLLNEVEKSQWLIEAKKLKREKA